MTARERFNDPAPDDDDADMDHPDFIAGQPPAMQAPDNSDDALRKEFVRRHKATCRYVGTLKCWFKWDGQKWREDTDGAVLDLVSDLTREASSLETDKRRALSLASTVKRDAVERMVRSDREMVIEASAFDADPWLLNTPGGVVDLKTGKLMPHDPDFMLTQMAALTPAKGKPERWLRFLHQATGGDRDYEDYLHRFAGHSTTGRVEQLFHFAHGKGGSGKGTYLRVLVWMLGDYATSIGAEVLTKPSGDRHPVELMAFRNRRLVVASEFSASSKWNDPRVKLLSGGDDISARGMREDFITFRPTHALAAMSNDKPAFATVDEGVKRRLRLLPFTHKPPKVIKDLDEIMFQDEGPQILNWAIEGCLRWQAIGLDDMPEVVRQETEQYLGEEDHVGRWIKDCCETGDECEEMAQELFASWTKWCGRNREKPGSEVMLARELERRGFEKRRVAQGSRWLGIETTDADKRDRYIDARSKGYER